MIKKVVSIIVVFSLLFTIGCLASRDLVKPNQDEIDEYIKNNPDLPELDKACIYDGRFEVGMKTSTVEFLLGEPKERETVVQPWAEQEKWIYKVGGEKIFYMEDNGVVGIEEL